MSTISRRGFLASSAGVAAGLAGMPASAAKAAGDASRPNILYIMTDQQSATMLGCTGNKYLNTPALDRLSASGVRFERAYATNPVCVPSRFSLQTGLMPSSIGMSENADGNSSVVTDDMMSGALGNCLMSAGYETVFGGKTHFPKRMRDVTKLGYRNLTSDSRDELAQACADFIGGPHEKPFFLFASFINPHDICYMAINDFGAANGKPPIGNLDSRICEETLDIARNSGDLDAFIEKHCPPLPANHDIPENEPEGVTEFYTEVRPFREYARRNWTDQQWRLHRWLYCRLTERVDRQIGIVLDALKASGLEENTLVIFTSDHGDHDGSHKLEHKSIPYEEAARVPFIMSHKGRIAEGAVNDTHLISNGLDLLPTLCDYAGAEVPQGRVGASVRPIAEGESAPWRDHLVVESQNGRVVRTDRFKYCVYEGGSDREQFTDLENDPGEMDNLAGRDAYAREMNRHRSLLAQWVDKIDDKIGARYIVRPD